MARITTYTCKLCRREGEKLFLKGARCLSSKCSLTRRAYAPGVHGPGRPGRPTDYGKQLREKQKAKRLYGLSETQFANYYKKSVKTKGDSGVTLVKLLETRFDNVIFRSGLAKSRAAARQLVTHSHFTINGRKVNVPSFQVKSGQVIAVQERKHKAAPWTTMSEDLKGHQAPSWLSTDPSNLSVKVTSQPAGEELKQSFEPKLIIEYYSR